MGKCETPTQRRLITDVAFPSSNFGKSTDDFTCMLNRQFAAEMFERLSAREVRDMVYFHLMGGAPDVSIIQREKDLPDNERNWYYFHVDHSDRRGQARVLDNKFAHYFKEKYMGKEFMIEFAEEFNRHASYKVWHVGDVPFLLGASLLRDAPCRPLDFLRTLSVDICISSHTFQSARGYVKARHVTVESVLRKEGFQNQLSWLSDLAAAAQVSKMSVTLNVNVRSDIVLARYKAVLLPYIQELIEKDCKVVVSYENWGFNDYRQEGNEETITYDRTMLISESQMEAAIADAFIGHRQTL